MSTQSGSLICTITCWGIAALTGVLAAALLWTLGGWSFLQGAFIGIVILLVGGALLTWLLCKPLPAPGSVPVGRGTPSARPAGTKPPAATETKSGTPDDGSNADAVDTAPAAKAASTQLPGEQDLASRKGDWKYEGGAAPAAPAAPAADDGAESQPETLTGPRDGSADDLKKIKGVGPKLEGTLNELGFYHFDQIAKWTRAEVNWVDTRLKFKGRIDRDGWIEQAKILADGGETEFSKRK